MVTRLPRSVRAMGHEPDANVDEEGDEESQRVPRLAIERIASRSVTGWVESTSAGCRNI